jgi:hypothetical protein
MYNANIRRGRGSSPGVCSLDIEMSGLVEIEMSSFGAASPTLLDDPATERGDAEVSLRDVDRPACTRRVRECSP